MTTSPSSRSSSAPTGLAAGEASAVAWLGDEVDMVRARASAVLRAATGRGADAIARTITRDQILAYYQECWQPRLWAGHNPTSRAMHFGLYAGAGGDPEEARLRLDACLADLAALAAGPARLLDAGCGVGGPALHLARRHPGLRVTGVDLSPEQVGLARQLAATAGLGDRLEFQESDYRDTRLPAGSFDVVLAEASLGHCDDRPQFAREAFRLVRPGGCVVVADLFRSTRPLTMLEVACHEALLQGFVLADCFGGTPEEVFGAAGFVAPWFEDLTERALPGMRRSAERASVLLQSVQLPPLRRAHERACVAVHALCQSGAMSYGVFRARKPGAEVHP